MVDLERIRGQVLTVPGRIQTLFLPKESAAIKTTDTESEEITDPAKTLHRLLLKAFVMVPMMDDNAVEQPFIDKTRFLVMTWFSNLVSDGGIEGLDNLQEAVRESRKPGKRLILTPAHLADADHLAMVYLMRQRMPGWLPEQRGIGIQDDLVFMGGAGNMQLRESIKRFTRAVDVIYNVTPRDMGHLATLLEKQDEFGFNKWQKEKLGMVKVIFDHMREESAKVVRATCVDEGKPVVAYIEGGRSYDGFLKPALGSFSKLLPRDDSADILPVRIYGTRELNPPGTDPKHILRKELIPGLRVMVSMKVGPRYPSSEVWEIWRKRMQEARQINGEKPEINPMDWCAANIANLDWQYVKPEERQRHIDLLERFAPGRLDRSTLFSIK